MIPALTLIQYYELLKQAAKFSQSLPVCSRINTWAVLYERADFNKANLGMKAGDIQTERFWTNGSVALENVSTPYPVLSAIDYAGAYIDRFDHNCRSTKSYDIALIVCDPIIEANIGLTDGCDGRNITRIFHDTEIALDFVTGYLKKVEAFEVDGTPGWHNRDHLVWLKANAEITTYGQSVEAIDASTWYTGKIEELNKQMRIQRWRNQTKDGVAGSYTEIKLPVYMNEDTAPLFYVDTIEPTFNG